ncbi:DUF1476 family protein [Peteryoungia desertarenae]|uniref:DUF1476 family protein n=1 Tax=Peteryoungia desertarenae TaxID=1813451 RepID=A0ABX6QQX3_9HYPH|nr:ATPase inhibitor subunit zeta [Peteryoungia desertarenae]QLF70899.1 DUF1476 family protein [Peteryoungia desertarenae]
MPNAIENQAPPHGQAGGQDHDEGEGLGSIRERRNFLAGYWAGGLIGFNGADLARYARDLHKADHVVTGDSDVVSCLHRDLTLAGHRISKSEIEKKLKGFHAQALKDTGCTE